MLSWYYSCKKALEENNGDCPRGNGWTGVQNPVGVEKIIEDECTPHVLDTKL